MFSFTCLDIFIVSNEHRILLLPTENVDLSLETSLQSLAYSLIESMGLNYLRTERFGVQKSFLDNIFGMMKACYQFCWVLDIWPDESSFWIGFHHNIVGFFELSIRFIDSKVIVLKRSCEYSIFLHNSLIYLLWKGSCDFH